MALTGPKTDRRSSADNAFDFLTDLRAYMLEEPLRVEMNWWGYTGDKLKVFAAVQGTRTPVCGAVGCMAGDICLLKNGKRSLVRLLYEGTTSERALDIIASFNDEIRDDLETEFTRTWVGERGRQVPYGTKKYARIVANRVRDFQRRWRKELKATKITRRS